MSQKVHLGSLLSLILLAPTLSTADSFTQLFGSNDFEQLKRAYDTVRDDFAVREVLSESSAAGIQALSVASKSSGYGVETTKFQHYYKGLEVMGSMTFHHSTGADASVQSLLSHFDLDTTPAISAESAVAIAKSIGGDRELAQAPELKILPAKTDGSARLIYWVDLANQGLSPGSDVLIDAHTGQIFAHISKMETLAPVQVMTAKKQGMYILPIAAKNATTGKWEVQNCKLQDQDKGTEVVISLADCKVAVRGEDIRTLGKCELVLLDAQLTPDQVPSGDPLSLDPSACKQVVNSGIATPNADSGALNALNNTNKVLSYYKDTHGRNSFDNQGTAVTSVVHVGVNYANAAWVKGMDFMLYGDGDGKEMGDMTRGLDVAGHEMTHGVTSKTAKLTMMDEAGALNEANSDFFGKMIAQDGSWVIGKSLAIEGAKFAGIRDLSNPGNLSSTYRDTTGTKVTKPYPAKVSEQEKKKDGTTCDSTNDRCWVHYNSTIPSHAAYMIHQLLGKSKTETLYYLTLTQFLPSEATFKTAAQATLDACKALIRTGKLTQSECDQAKSVFTQVGMI